MKRISDSEAIIIQKAILAELHEYCVKHDLKYSLAYGSLLGAVRHKDMIPWDDDIDIMMPREDFEMFCETYPQDGNKNYAAENHRTNPEIKTRLAYFTDTRTITYNIGYRKEDNIQTYGLHIDIYPVDYIPDGKLSRRLFFFKRTILFTIVRGAALHPEIRSQKAKRLILSSIRTICRLFGEDRCIDALVRHCRKYEKMQPTDESEVSVLLEVGKPICFSHRIMKEYQEYDYANQKYYGIKDYETCLKLWYGDYMKLPPESERIPHKFAGTEYYWKQEG